MQDTMRQLRFRAPLFHHLFLALLPYQMLYYVEVAVGAMAIAYNSTGVFVALMWPKHFHSPVHKYHA